MKEPDTQPLRTELASTLNRYSAENGSNTPDFILAQFLQSCLIAFDTAVNERARWYGRADSPGGGSNPLTIPSIFKCAFRDCPNDSPVRGGFCSRHAGLDITESLRKYFHQKPTVQTHSFWSDRNQWCPICDSDHLETVLLVVCPKCRTNMPVPLHIFWFNNGMAAVTDGTNQVTAFQGTHAQTREAFRQAGIDHNTLINHGTPNP